MENPAFTHPDVAVRPPEVHIRCRKCSRPAVVGDLCSKHELEELRLRQSAIGQEGD